MEEFRNSRRLDIPIVILVILLFASPFLITVVSSQTGTTTTGKQQVDYLIAEDSPGARISRVSQNGAYSVIYDFQDYNNPHVYPDDVVADSAGHLIVAECGMDTLARITLPNTVTDIATFPSGSCPASVVIDSAGNYIVALATANELVKVTPLGVVTVIQGFTPSGTDCGPMGWGNPLRIAIDSSGNYIVTECALDRLSKVTPAGVYSVIYNFAKGTSPSGVAIDPSGNYIVGECGTMTISKITPSGERTVVYKYPAGTPSCNPWGFLDVAIDPSGNYIVAEYLMSTISKITPDGVRTPIFTIPRSQYNTTQHPCSVEIVNASLFEAITSTTLTASASSVSTSTTPTTPASTTTASASSQTTTTTQGAIPEFAPYAVAGVVATIIIVAASALVLRKRH